MINPGEIVFCFHGDRIFTTKVWEVRLYETGISYSVTSETGNVLIAIPAHRVAKTQKELSEQCAKYIQNTPHETAKIQQSNA